jgi:hypothetical protein
MFNQFKELFPLDFVNDPETGGETAVPCFAGIPLALPRPDKEDHKSEKARGI